MTLNAEPPLQGFLNEPEQDGDFLQDYRGGAAEKCTNKEEGSCHSQPTSWIPALSYRLIGSKELIC